MRMEGLVGKDVQIRCVDKENFIDWWEWGCVDYATPKYLVIKTYDGDYVLIEKKEIKEVYLVEKRTKIHPKTKK